MKENKSVKSKVDDSTVFSQSIKKVESNFLLCLVKSTMMVDMETYKKNFYFGG